MSAHMDQLLAAFGRPMEPVTHVETLTVDRVTVNLYTTPNGDHPVWWAHVGDIEEGRLGAIRGIGHCRNTALVMLGWHFSEVISKMIKMDPAPR